MKEFKLNKEPKLKTGFSTPEGYFDSFSDRFSTKLPESEPKVISVFNSRKIWYYAVAAILILLLSIPVYIQYESNSKEIDSEMLEDYITNHSTITEYEIVSLLETEDLEKIKIDLKLQDKELEELLLNNSELEQYLIN